MTGDRETTLRDRERAKDVIWRVTAAVETMCIGQGDIRSRLLAAVRDHLLPLREEDFPVALRPKYRRILEAATKYDSSDLDVKFPLPHGKSHGESEGLLGATMRRIRRNTGADIAKDIWSLYQELLVVARRPRCSPGRGIEGKGGDRTG